IGAGALLRCPARRGADLERSPDAVDFVAARDAPIATVEAVLARAEQEDFARAQADAARPARQGSSCAVARRTARPGLAVDEDRIAYGADALTGRCDDALQEAIAFIAEPALRRVGAHGSGRPQRHEIACRRRRT